VRLFGRLFMPNKRGFDRETVLEALQAVCIYTILQSQDPDSLERNNARSMISTLSVSYCVPIMSHKPEK
jgi:hypothetical protein